MINLKKEKDIFRRAVIYLGGIDEAGRGPLAGPVVAACVLSDPDFSPLECGLEMVNDSKKISEKKRNKLYNKIKKGYIDVGIGVCDHKTIDRINILQASFLAMKKAIGALHKKPDFILVDGKFSIPNISIKQEAIIQGDKQVFSIAAASILAKVARDNIMLEYHKKYPEYGFDRHKGYGTKFHIEQLQKLGPCEIHRLSFKPVSEAVKNK